jgi:hypothetical protein
VSAHEALVALARDLVEEMAAGMAVELAAGGTTFTVDPMVKKPEPPPKGAAAIHPQLGGHLERLPGDTISMHAYKHLGTQPPIPGP